MGKITVGVVRERAPGERRVAMVPDVLARLAPLGAQVLVEAGAGAGAWFADADYAAAGAEVVPGDEVWARADVVLCVRPPEPEGGTGAPGPRSGQTLAGLLEPLRRPALMRDWAERGVTAVSLDLLPRTLSRAQSMDALTSQANIAGYKAVILAADAYDRYFPMLTTAAGTSKPAAVLILGAGVAGLQAIATARRLGAVVTGYDVRPAAKGEVESLGARFLELPGVESGAGTGGYARELTPEEQRAQQEALDAHIARSDIVITTAQVPGRRPPLLVTGAALERMKPGSVVVDMAASEFGGNVEQSRPDKTTVLEGGVTLIGAGNLPSAMATASSTAYARNLTALLNLLVKEGAVTIDREDEIQAGVVVTHDGSVVSPGVAALLESEPGTGGTGQTSGGAS
ncbi:Re/Si-specific NAD(P)(+) transhydrogenase subunit alpha [Streptomyces sp. YIM 98790]|uniref:Re/Si-specific NAD(P)(+) transhydrogenase subunit alpha n=1 Tax=Streptomyces sp. YIM 98790 TaxID=2689077 RepID=UPI00140D2B1F|nr:Re/Si-specific NAD(P)(+) transhydrogenase subunit alpha [Streptomyces sp. YIM 98790]